MGVQALDQAELSVRQLRESLAASQASLATSQAEGTRVTQENKQLTEVK